MKVSNDCTDLAIKSFFKHTKLKENDKFVMIDNDGDWYHNWNNGQINPDDIIINESLQNTSKNINTLFLEVGHNNSKMHSFCEKNGMQQTSVKYWQKV